MIRFNIQTKRRVYAVYVEFDKSGEHYEIDIYAIDGRRRKNVVGWQEVEITSDPLTLAKNEVAKYELREDYADRYDDKVFSLDSEQAAELVKQVHEVEVNDWQAGQKGVVRWEQTKAAKTAKQKGASK
ncbi:MULTISPECIES: hypothetical protein [Thermoactinomyces]|uniref:Uncharacterized protein n=1 Tax=Thermoactinomyces daqus TaxID=1329516 RepID=A0A7W2AIG5_9BACL|nr:MULTISPECIES: hypothetical protein [Thermoactinomyces]MBA4542714.1 hypothetical protein [Thermoactinomyces daqus]MBH8607284.1 hypothetical protein [Thermoactinomyces sp. CICC 10521]